MPFIFQYGSNCDTERLNGPDRLAGDAKDLGLTQTRDNFELEFNKWSTTGHCAAADLLKPRRGGRRIWGVLYEVSSGGFEKLKTDIEGPSYRPQYIAVADSAGATQFVQTFRVRRNKRQAGRHTTADYVGHIVKGLRDHGVGELDRDYLGYVIDRAVRTNEKAGDQEAGREQNDLIRRLL